MKKKKKFLILIKTNVNDSMMNRTLARFIKRTQLIHLTLIKESTSRGREYGLVELSITFLLKSVLAQVNIVDKIFIF